MSDSSSPVLTTAAIQPGSPPIAGDYMLVHEEHPTALAHQFDDLAQQKESVTLGMWAFLATEVMFFGGLFIGYAVYRSRYPEIWAAASQGENWFIGAINTGVLLCSSLTVVLAVHAAQHDDRRGIVKWFGATVLLGLVFLGIKAYEYTHLFHAHHVPGRDFRFHAESAQFAHLPPELVREKAQLFFSFYFAMTGIHALHMVVGIGIFAFIMYHAWKGRFSKEYYNPVEVGGLYWHFVDVVWIFLFPLFYLVDPLSFMALWK